LKFGRYPPSRLNPLGGKGAGEGGITPAGAAIASPRSKGRAR
jgi:CO/xanthine dehydrogenase Mo-binding subunit